MCYIPNSLAEQIIPTSLIRVEYGGEGLVKGLHIKEELQLSRRALVFTGGSPKKYANKN